MLRLALRMLFGDTAKYLMLVVGLFFATFLMAQQAGVLPKDIILEVKLRAFLLEQLAKNGMTTMKEVSQFCQAYSKDADGAVASLGLDRDQLLGRKS